MDSNKTSRSASRAQAYRQGMKTPTRQSNYRQSRTTLAKQESLSNATNKSSTSINSESTTKIDLKVEKPKRVKVEPKVISEEEQALAKARQERIKKREQQFKEEQKRRIEEALEQQKSRVQKNKDLAERLAKENSHLTPSKTRESEPTTAKKTTSPNRLNQEQKLDEILNARPKSTSSNQTRPRRNVSIDDYQTTQILSLDNLEKAAKKELQETAKESSPRLTEVIEKEITTTSRDDANNSISKNEEKELLERIGKINELELTNRINRLTKEVLSDIDDTKEINEIKKPQTNQEKLLNTDVITLNRATKEALNNLEKKAKIEKKELKKAKKHPNKVKKQEDSNGKSQKKKSVIPLIFVLIISLGVFAYSAFNIVKWQQDNNQIKDITEKINDTTDVQEVVDNKNVEVIEPPKNVQKSDPYWDYIKVPLISVDFNELKSTNKETVGWIQVMGTNINYPFVQTKDNSYYLSHDFSKKVNSAGWVFMDYRNNVQEFDRNNIIYAHGRLDTTMFGSLKNILSSGWLKNTDNYVIRLSTEYENTLWQVFSVYRIKTTNDYIQVEFDDDAEFNEFAKMLIGRSAHNFNTTIASTDKILTLSTCYNQTDKVVLHAKLIKRETRN